MTTIGAIIPAYEAADTVGDVVRGCHDAGVAAVIVVDDGSSDGTADAARTAGAEVIRHPENRGKGAALATGYARATERGWEAAIALDADAQHDPTSIPAFLDAWRATGADVLIGTRRRSGTRMPLARRLSNRLSSTVVSRLAGTWIADSQSGYRLVSRRAWEAVRPTGARYDWESEFLVRAGRLGLHIGEVPIATRYGSERSHFRAGRDTVRLIGLYWRLFRLEV